ncbi:MAG: PfkB family carbohydrate kinase [Verrucomicrobiota bacterium]
MRKNNSSVLVLGSMAIDDVATPSVQKKNLLGGSSSFASVAASFFIEPRLVGIVGNDFPKKYIELFKKRKVDLRGLEIADGLTFRWSGIYEKNMNNRRTLSIALNVFEHFNPKLPTTYRETPYVLLGNIAPSLQLRVLEQMKKPAFIAADTMDLWIDTARADLMKLLRKIDLLILNDSEALSLSGEPNLVRAARWLKKQGPRYVAIKKGEHGCFLSGSNEHFAVPAIPLEKVVDPTGAGDTFAGALVGYLASTGKTDFNSLKKAVVEGTIMASFTVEDFSLNRLPHLSRSEHAKRKNLLRKLTQY